MPLATCVQLADFIEKQSAATLTSFCALSVFKIYQLRLESLHTESRATEFHEWQSPLTREFVDLQGDDFFPCPTLSLYEDGNFCRRNLRQELLHGLHFRAQSGQKKLLSKEREFSSISFFGVSAVLRLHAFPQIVF